jgi:molybdopterin-containing oxidoreductase family iron-sulfur binding subunit
VRHKHEFPTNLQLNPEVTVRDHGVMEKCTFCVQRIVSVKQKAKIENRPIRDQEIQPACVQTCPTDAIVFGDLHDKDSRVNKLIEDTRRYQLLAELNTKPGVIYLKKIKIKT